MERKRKEIGISQVYMYLHFDTIFLNDPNQSYFDDYKAKQSVNDIKQFVRISIWIGQTEVTNRQYNYFLSSLLKDSLITEYELYKPNHEGWTNIDSLNEFYVSQKEKYSTDEFLDFPVVNISKEAITAFISWLNKNEPSSNVIYKLPDETEWKKGFNDTNINDSTYSWGHSSCKNDRNLDLGNFALLNPEQWRYNHITDKFWFHDFDSLGYLAKINGPMIYYSFNPSTRGTYNMSGNVAELIYVQNDTIEQLARTKGGSWLSPPYYGRKHAWERYKLPSPCVGFRLVKYVIEK